MLSQQEGCCLGNLIARTSASGCRGINHALIALTIGIELIVSQRGNDDTRADGVDTGTTFLPTWKNTVTMFAIGKVTTER